MQDASPTGNTTYDRQVFPAAKGGIQRFFNLLKSTDRNSGRTPLIETEGGRRCVHSGRIKQACIQSHMPGSLAVWGKQESSRNRRRKENAPDAAAGGEPRCICPHPALSSIGRCEKRFIS